jgi:hypothetical protein
LKDSLFPRLGLVLTKPQTTRDYMAMYQAAVLTLEILRYQRMAVCALMANGTALPHDPDPVAKFPKNPRQRGMIDLSRPHCEPAHIATPRLELFIRDTLHS